ncbi:hypothetical protein [Altererythrobacter sp. MF3-039]|uniref:hypothetical protein n=1 Tax=Altererythrobacter sp. MF3-039 TaxID=3252901 RepID=UPI00390C44DC
MLEQIYWVSQSFAALLVLGSLYFVAVQIRQNTKAVRAASRHENEMDWSRLNYDMANNPNTARIFALLQDSSKTIEDVSSEDLVPLQLLFRSTLMTFQAHYFSSKEGSLPTDHWIWERDYARRFIRTPIGSVIYQMELDQGAVRDGFREEIEGDAELGNFDLGATGVKRVLARLVEDEGDQSEPEEP